MESVECSSCHRTFNDGTLLSLHREYEACATSNATPWQVTYSCPLCDDTFDDPQILEIHVNEIHDSSSEQSTVRTSDSFHDQDVERRKRMKLQYEQHREQTASSLSHEELQEDEDARIARLLQDEEDAQSFEDFQHRYGGSTKTFSDRAQENLDKLLKKKFITQNKYDEYKRNLDQMIAQPTERIESRSTGIIPLLSALPMNNLIDRSVCRPACDHMSSTWLDQGWSCGYKNFQMLLSSLRHDPQYSTLLFGHDATDQSNCDIPSVSYLQKLIENAWAAGFDSDGREQLNGHLINSTKWIGSTEVMACLANLNIKAELFDFHQPKALAKSVAYSFLFEWIRDYFRQQQRQGDTIIHPLYLQHQGHSRTIVGYEQFRNGSIRLLIFDPSTSKADVEKFVKSPNEKAHLFRRTLQSFQKPEYQILVVRRLLNPNEREAAKQLRSTKVPLP